MSVRLHPTAIIEAEVEIGAGTSVWDNTHIRGPARIGRDCIIGEKSYIAYGVTIGNRVKINAFVYLCTGVTIEDGVMIAAGAIFTNDRYPRAASADLTTLRGSGPDEFTEETLVKAGATIGAGAVIGPGLTIGRYAMIGMGAIVTGDVPDHHLVVGHPARPRAVVCRCGAPLLRLDEWAGVPKSVECVSCGDRYAWDGQALTLASEPALQ
jgi:acetyltransferase-like isoleucine patch superfamily enzyme